MTANREHFDNAIAAKVWAYTQLSEVWGDEWENLTTAERLRVHHDLLDSDRTAREIRADIWAGNLKSYAQSLGVNA